MIRGQRLKLHIDRLSIGGRGVGRHEKMVVFVGNTAPNENVEVELTKVKKNFAEAKLIKVIEASPFRIAAPCPVAEVCGGCTWQHVEYEEQLRQKRELVRDALRKFSGFDVTALSAVEPVIPSPNQFRYRNRIQLHHKGAMLGFFQRASHQIVDINDCPITENAIANRIPLLRANVAGKPPGRLEIYLTQQGSVAERDALNEEDGAGPAFSQVNTAQNAQLIRAVIDALKQAHGFSEDHAGTIYDLYAGNGNFTFPIAEAFPNAKIASAELNKLNVGLARERAEANFPLRKIRIELQDVAEFLRQERLSTASLVLLDPPRTGCEPAVIEQLVMKLPQTIVYVSCHPVTLARDLQPLQSVGYQLIKVQPFDMFPQTDHVETLVVLSHPGITSRS